jgi:hypothetical protein
MSNPRTASQSSRVTAELPLQPAASDLPTSSYSVDSRALDEAAKRAGLRSEVRGVSTLWAGAVIAAVLVVTTIPWNMDEFIMYHVPESAT